MSDTHTDIDGLMRDALLMVGPRPTTLACPDCRARVEFGESNRAMCGCGARLVRPDIISDEHLSVIAALAPREQRRHWLRRAIVEELPAPRLRAEIKYTAWQFTYGPRPINAPRRSKQEIEAICAAIYKALLEDAPMTVRQVFYRLVSTGVIGKTEGEYKSTVVRLLGDMRRSGEVPFDWIADNTRWMRKPRTYSSLESMLQISAEAYRRAVWDNQNAYVEIWLEKDALAGVLMEETATWDVPLMVTRGYPSLSYLHSAAETIAAQGKPTHLYYFGDYDPSGLDIPRKVESDLRQFAPDADISFNRVAVTRAQIKAMKLPTRPTKKTDSRSKGFVGESVEVDAIPPRTLREIVRRCITRHVDEREYEALKLAEASERDALKRWVDSRATGDDEFLG